MAIRDPVPCRQRANWLRAVRVRWCLREGCSKRESRSIECSDKGCTRDCHRERTLEGHQVSVCLEYGLVHITQWPSAELSVAFCVTEDELEAIDEKPEKALEMAVERVQSTGVA